MVAEKPIPIKITRLISGRISYIDTLWLCTYQPFHQQTLAELRRECRSVRVFTLYYQSYGLARRYIIQGPSRAALRLLKTALGHNRYVISRVDIALDLCTTTSSRARLLQDFFDTHLSQRWPGNKPVCNYEQTTYFRPAGSSRNFTIYSDRPSKKTTFPACRIERRFGNANGCKSASANFFTIDDLMDINFRDFWSRQLLLFSVDPQKLSMEIDKRVAAYKQTLTPSELRFANSCKTSAQFRLDEEYILQEALRERFDIDLPVVSDVSTLGTN